MKLIPGFQGSAFFIYYFNKFAGFINLLMTLKERIESFSELGKILRDSLEGNSNRYSSDLEYAYQITSNSKIHWFTPENVKMAIKAIADELTFENL